MVIWITGLGTSGKTTMAKRLCSVIPRSVLLDGDEFRRRFEADFSDDGRRQNIMRIGQIAAMLEEQGMVPIVACVSPTVEFRNEARALFKESVLIYMPGGTQWEDSKYDIPDNFR